MGLEVDFVKFKLDDISDAVKIIKGNGDDLSQIVIGDQEYTTVVLKELSPHNGPTVLCIDYDEGRDDADLLDSHRKNYMARDLFKKYFDWYGQCDYLLLTKEQLEFALEMAKKEKEVITTGIVKGCIVDPANSSDRMNIDNTIEALEEAIKETNYPEEIFGFSWAS